MTITIDRTQARQYSDGIARYYSVSQVCAVLAGPQWGSQEAMDRGTRVHRLCALLLAAQVGLCERPTIQPKDAGYAASFEQWVTIAKPEPVEIEEPRVSTVPGLKCFGGTPDLVCWMHDHSTRMLCVVDLKTGTRARWHRVQVQAYGKLVPEAKRLGVLYLDREGGLPTWEIVKPNAADWTAFQSALNVLIYREGNP